MTTSSSDASRAGVVAGLERGTRIWVAGHRGMVGSAVLRRLQAAGYRELVLRSHADLDLTERPAVRDFIAETCPEVVFLCAAHVGGIGANARYPAQFLHDNLAIQDNVVHECWRAGVQRLVFLGSSCIYPRDCPQPIREDYLLGGPLEFTNRPYAIAKIAGVEACWAYNREYGTRYFAVMPTNLYGRGDNYHAGNSHVLPALIRRYHEAVRDGDAVVTNWGSGRPRREFLFADDLADAVVMLCGRAAGSFDDIFPAQQPPLINVGVGADLSIAELADMVAGVTGFAGEVRWDSTRPDGTPRKLLDVSRLRALGWSAPTGLAEGLRCAYQDFLARFQTG